MSSWYQNIQNIKANINFIVHFDLTLTVFGIAQRQRLEPVKLC